MKNFIIYSILDFGLLAQGQLGPRGRGSKKAPAAEEFAADSRLPVLALQDAVAGAKVVPDLAVYPVKQGDGAVESTIHSDWVGFKEGAALSWIADMDVDCDGIDYQCEGNPDGQKLTNWGAVSAYHVPYIVIPDRFLTANPKMLPGNNVAAVICGGKMFYSILADTNGDTPQVTGEASLLLARTCFPDEGLGGASGHTQSDVTYIVFIGSDAVLPSSALNDKYITDFTKLRSMGDKLVGALTANLGLDSSKPRPQPPSPTSPSEPPSSSGTSSSDPPSSSDTGTDAESSASLNRRGTVDITLYLSVLVSYIFARVYLY